jgi:hypothetical protein
MRLPGHNRASRHDKRLTPRGEKIVTDSLCSLLIFFYGMLQAIITYASVKNEIHSLFKTFSNIWHIADGSGFLAWQ